MLTLGGFLLRCSVCLPSAWYSDVSSSPSPLVGVLPHHNPPHTLPPCVPWLIVVIMKGRDEEAKVVLQRLHDDHVDSSFWEKEYVQIHAQLAQDRAEAQGSSWLEMFSNPIQRKRTAVSVMTMVMTQTTGAQTIQVYQVRPPTPTTSPQSNTRPPINLIYPMWVMLV